MVCQRLFECVNCVKNKGFSYSVQKMDENYRFTKKTKEFQAFKTYLNRVLTQRGRRRQENIEVVDNYFCKVWCDAQTLHLDQYRELMADKRKLKNELRDLKEEQDKELLKLERQIDSLREQLLVRKIV